MARNERATALFYADGRQFVGGLNRMEKRMGGFKRTVSRALGGLKSIAGFGGIAGLVGGGLGLAKTAGEAVEFDDAMTRLNIATSGAIGPVGDLQKRIMEVSSATGVARGDIMKSLSSFVALTGDAKGATASMELFAKVQRATAASMDDITASAAAMQQNLKIRPEDMERAFSVLIKGGKAGAIELKDVAGLLAGLSPLAARFAGGTGVAGLADLGSALQLARQGFGSAEEAATGLESLMGAIVKNAAKLEKQGVKVFDKDAAGNKSMRGLMEIVESIGNSKLATDPTLLIDALGRKEAEQAYLQLTKNEGAWRGLSAATRNAKDVSEDYHKYQQSSAATLSKAFNDIKLVVAEAFTPERIQEFAEFVKEMVPFVRELAFYMMEFAKQMGVAVQWTADLIGYNARERGIEGLARTPDAEKNLPSWARDAIAPDVAKRRAQIAKEDAKRADAELHAAPSINARPAALAAEPEWSMESDARATQRGRAKDGSKVDVSLYMDPSTTDIKGKVDNHRSQRR